MIWLWDDEALEDYKRREDARIREVLTDDGRASSAARARDLVQAQRRREREESRREIMYAVLLGLVAGVVAAGLAFLAWGVPR